MMTIEEYIRYRFIRNNHSKYLKYFEEWYTNITKEQLQYFIEEKKRLKL